MVEVERDRVESIHTGQKTVALELKEILKNLPVPKTGAFAKTQETHIRATSVRRNGLVPCCQEAMVCTLTGHPG